MADEKIIFSMNGVGKILPHNNRVILKDIYLSFFYGAKIGIVGLNGSGKSTLMKIIAGIEKGYQGEVVWAPGYSVGYLEQEPHILIKNDKFGPDTNIRTTRVRMITIAVPKSGSNIISRKNNRIIRNNGSKPFLISLIFLLL